MAQHQSDAATTSHHRALPVTCKPLTVDTYDLSSLFQGRKQQPQRPGQSDYQTVYACFFLDGTHRVGCACAAVLARPEVVSGPVVGAYATSRWLLAAVSVPSNWAAATPNAICLLSQAQSNDMKPVRTREAAINALERYWHAHCLHGKDSRCSSCR